MQYIHQPSMPEYSTYETISSCTMKEYAYTEEEYEQNEVEDHIIGALRECLEEIDIKGKELFHKVISKYDVEIPLGRLAREAIGDTRAKDFLGKITKKVIKKIKTRKDHDEFVVAERDVSIDEEMNQKLERFKVKTINIGGVVVKEEEK